MGLTWVWFWVEVPQVRRDRPPDLARWDEEKWSGAGGGRDQGCGPGKGIMGSVVSSTQLLRNYLFTFTTSTLV